MASPSGGEVIWNGGNIGYIAHQPMLYGSLSVRRTSRFWGNVRYHEPKAGAGAFGAGGPGCTA